MPPPPDFDIPEPVTADDLIRTAAGPPRWLWDGYLAAGALTLLTSRWKAGKTTLLSLLLARTAAGGSLFGGRVGAGRAVVVSEEDPALWAGRAERLGIAANVAFLCRPFRGRPPSAAAWAALIDRLAERPGLALAVIDPLASFLPSDENNATTVLAALAPLGRLTAAGAAVLLLHHPRKIDGQPRGSGALSGFADVLLTMDGPASGRADDRRRTLRAASRFALTPREVTAELSADGRDYAAVNAAADEFAAGWAVLHGVLEDARHKLTRREALECWPEDHPAPSAVTLWRWLDDAVEAGLVARCGTGRRAAPYRYWLPGRASAFGCGLPELPELPELPPVDQRAFLRVAASVLSRLPDD